MEMTVKGAATFIRWYGYDSNCLHGNKEVFRAAVAIVRDAPPLMELEGGERIIAVVFGEVAFLLEGFDAAGWGCHFARYEIGGLSAPIGQMVLRKGSPSRLIHNTNMGLYGVALTPADAQRLGIGVPLTELDAESIREVFGSNVEYV